MKLNDLKKVENWKELRYNKRPEAWGVIIVSSIICGIILYGILSNTIDKHSGFAIAGFVFFAIGLIVGLWMLISKKGAPQYVYEKGWKYQLYKKGNKYLFISIVGAVEASKVVCILLLLHWFKLFLPEKQSFNKQEIAVSIVMFLFIALIAGYREYKKYLSIQQ
ncbi:hypothetical protein AGMMS49982_13630 [Bacteroidia bacterium]|nr:hypothetical protein AGMMS49982_13630 [Bacteroidia bacterium]